MKKDMAVGMALLTLAAVVQAQTIQDLPAKFVSVCYDWAKQRNWAKDLTPQELETSLTELIAKSPSIPGRTASEERENAAAVQWGETLEERRDCDRAPFSILNVHAAVDVVHRKRHEQQYKQNSEAQAEFLRQHANDPITIDYTEYRQSVAGRAAKPRKPAGTVKKLTLAQYLSWETQMKDKWAAAVMNAGNNVNIMHAHTQCKTDIAQQWKTSFGYVDAVLRSPALVEAGVARERVTAIACMTPFLQMGGIPVTDNLPR